MTSIITKISKSQIPVAYDSYENCPKVKLRIKRVKMVKLSLPNANVKIETINTNISACSEQHQTPLLYLNQTDNVQNS